MNAITKFAMQVARQWQRVPDNVSDEEALAKGFITPEMIELIMAVVTQIFTECLANNRQQAWNRVRAYVNEKSRIAKMADSVGLLNRIDRWWVRLAMPRETGDVRALREALTVAAESVPEDQFKEIHTAALFLAI